MASLSFVTAGRVYPLSSSGLTRGSISAASALAKSHVLPCRVDPRVKLKDDGGGGVPLASLIFWALLKALSESATYF